MFDFTLNSKLFAVVIAASVTMTGCATINNMTSGLMSGNNEETQFLKDPRIGSIYDTSGFAYNANEAMQKATKNAKVVCKNKTVQVISDKSVSRDKPVNGQQKTIYIVDLTYRCGS